MSRCSAWLLSFGGKAQAVIGQGELLHLVQKPLTYPVPGAPEHCRQVVVWEGTPLPLFEVGVWTDPDAPRLPVEILAVVGFQPTGSDRPSFGALTLMTTPQRIEVDDTTACDLPPELQAWRPISCACFERVGRALPVLDLKRLFEAI